MSVKITLDCSGCGESAPGGRIKAEFRSFSGRSHGFGGAHVEIKWDVPVGWVKFDPYTYCTYCPDCWRSIDAPLNQEAVAND